MKSLPNQKGQVLIFVTLAFVVLGMFIGLAVDGGRGYLMRERLRSIVDAAALAGARALVGPADINVAKEEARKAACDWAKLNGLDAGECNTTKLTVEIGPVPGSGELGVIVTGTDTSRTFFMALGGLIGCDSCKTIDVRHVGIAVPDTLADVVLVMDDTGTMRCRPPDPCPIENAKAGASTLVDMLLSDPNSHARIAFVPFRGCYKDGVNRNTPAPLIQAYQQQVAAGIITQAEADRRGCILMSEMVDLTNDATALRAQINNRFGSGGYPGTNVCLGMHEGRNKLFGTGSRAIARKVMVILTDGDQTYSDSADGPQPSIGVPNLGNPTPTPYPAQPWTALVGDNGHDTIPPPTGSCKSATPPGNDVQRWGPEYDPAIYDLDRKAMDKASTLKNNDPSSSKIEIYVLRFALPLGDDLASGDPAGSCDPSLVPNTSVSGRQNSNDVRDRNLSRCLASNTAMGDPFSVTANDHYFYAATAADINAKFQAIATNILRKRRLVA